MTDPTPGPMLAKPHLLTGDNPFGLEPDSDLLASPHHDVPLWSETMFFLIWSPEQNVGL